MTVSYKTTFKTTSKPKSKTTSIPTTPDAELVVRLKAGDKPAFDLLVNTYHLPMLRFVCRIIGDAQAEEVVQETWLAAIRNLEKFEGRSSLKSWLYTIAANEAKSRLRKSKREVLINHSNSGESLFENDRFARDGHWAQPPPSWHDDSPEALLSSEDFSRCLEIHLQKLPDLQREALQLRNHDEMDFEEICNILAISASNVRVLIHRARVKIHAMVAHFEETGTC